MLAPGERLGGYTLVERSARRAKGELWLARSIEGDQVTLDVAILRAASETRSKQHISNRLPIARRLAHENVLPILGAGVDAGYRFWAFRHLEGLYLNGLLEGAQSIGTWPVPGVAWFIARSVASALAYAHSLPEPVIARDLSPDAILLARDGRVLVAGLGTADVSQDVIDTAGQSQSGVVAYLSPEVASNQSIDQRSDLFALGAIFWELLGHRPLFRRSTDLETLEAIRTGEVPPLPSECPAGLIAIATKLLQRSPDQRYGSARDLERDLDAITLAGTDRTTTAQLVETVTTAGGRSKKGRTSALSEASAGSETVESDPPSEILRQAGADVPSEENESESDPFFDAVRDGGGLESQRFEILGRLGSGGMGEVYRVRDRELEETAALKIIPKGSAIEGQSIERLRREVRLARRIASDHVCRIYDIVDLGDGSRGLMMELIDGTTLAEMMKAGIAVDYARFGRWGAEIADGLAAAHGLSIIHRDLKPENVMIRKDDQAVILDFGIARVSSIEEGSEKLTQAGIIMGTPLYMSPEQLSNRPLDGRSDLYALGLILAELITGKVPRGGKSYAEILDARVVKNERFTIKDADPNVPDPMARIIDQLLDASSIRRPGTATLVSQQLMAFVEDRSVGTGDIPRPTSGHSEVIGLDSPPEPAGQKRIDVPIFEVRKQSKAGWVVAIVLLAAVGGSLGYLHFRKEAAQGGPDASVTTPEDSGELDVEIDPPPIDPPIDPPPTPPPPPRSKVPDPEPM